MPSPTTYRAIFKGLDFARLDTDDTRCAVAVCLGFALGMTPLFTLHAMVLFALVLSLRVNPFVTALSYFFFLVVSAPFDPLFHRVGLFLLTPSFLQRMWAGFYHWPVLPHTRFYNTVVMGRGITVALGIGPLFFATRRALHRYRKVAFNAFHASTFGRAIASSRLYRFYVSYHQF